ncbi:hypothetical protein KR018_007933 [Drosophila ironensis]|nr:hypothetical protein KR018_007933 [Drosophila ironensis]
MDISADVDQIVRQAGNWNIEGDCSLLALMKRISQVRKNRLSAAYGVFISFCEIPLQNLKERGERTTQKFQEFETSVKRAEIGLNNATNSLRSLQFGNQFVEYRVEDVDDTDLAMPEDTKKKPEPPPLSSEQMAKEFMANNLKMFRKNYEAVTLEVPDSDDEDAPVTTTTVFRAINPYDAIPLPYVIGSREWHEHKYAGLYDSDENSDDQNAEEFSSSSSDEREPVSKITPKAAANTPSSQVEPLSDASSLASFAREPTHVSPARQPKPAAMPTPPPVQAAESGASKSQPRPIISSQRNPHERDMFAALRQSPPSDDPPSTSSSPSTSPAFGNAAGRLPKVSTASLSSSSNNNSPAHQTPPPLFEEAPAPAVAVPKKADSPPTPQEAQAKTNQIKRKPVNLFNDDEFNSFMTEITEKVQAKADGGSISKAKTASQTPAKESPKPQPVSAPSAPKRVNLFDDSPPMSPNIKQAAPPSRDQPKATIVPKELTKTLPKLFFDDDLDDDDFLSSFSPKPKPQEQQPKPPKPKSLFDDDDLDIDDIFVKPSAKPTKLPDKVGGKTTLFDDDDQDDVTDLFGAKKKQAAKSSRDLSPVEKIEPPQFEKKSLFDDEEDLFGTPKAKNLYSISQQSKDEGAQQGKHDFQDDEKTSASGSSKPFLKSPSQPIVVEDRPPDLKSISKKPDLFNEDFSDDDSFLKGPNITTKPEVLTNVAKESIKSIPASKPDDLFGEDETFLSAIKIKKTPKDEKPVTEIIEPNKDLTEEIMPEALPANKEDDGSIKKDNDFMAEMLSNSGNNPPISETPPPDDHPSGQDPIIAMVADITNKPPEDEYQARPPADLAAAQQIMQNYSNLFSDEPPDDSEFFQTLGSSGLSSLSTSKIFDNEQDFFEPALPKVPSATKPSVASPGEGIPPSSDYGGMQLFSDIPPDDFDADVETAPAQAPAQVSSTSTRIHTIFYDDFSETARAGSIAPAPKQSAFDEIPPPVDEVDRSKAKETPELPTPTSPVKKLKMPNIDINVKALLPGAAGLPKIKKQESPRADREESAPVQPESLAPIQQPTEISAPDGSLQHVNKTRVRGPPRRRPSTRKGRKENYEKSLSGEVSSPDNEAPPTKPVEAEKVMPSHSAFSAVPVPEEPPEDLTPSTVKVSSKQATAPGTASTAVPVSEEPPEDLHPSTVKVSSKQGTAPKTYKSFLDSPDEDDDFLFSPVKKQIQDVPKTVAPVKTAPNPQIAASASHKVIPQKPVKSFLDSSDEDDSLFASAKTKPVAPAKVVPSLEKTEPKNSSLKVGRSFLDSPSDDDSPFGSFKPQTAPPPKQETEKLAAAASTNSKTDPLPKTKQIAPAKKTTLFDESDDDDLFASAIASVPVTAATATAKSIAKTKEPPKPKASLFSSDEDEAVAPAKVAPAKKLPKPATKSLFSDDDDDDDLFGGSSTAKASSSKPTNRTVPKPPAPSKTTAAATTTIPHSSSDNPLADLLFE